MPRGTKRIYDDMMSRRGKLFAYIFASLVNVTLKLGQTQPFYLFNGALLSGVDIFSSSCRYKNLKKIVIWTDIGR